MNAASTASTAATTIDVDELELAYREFGFEDLECDGLIAICAPEDPHNYKHWAPKAYMPPRDLQAFITKVQELDRKKPWGIYFALSPMVQSWSKSEKSLRHNRAKENCEMVRAFTMDLDYAEGIHAEDKLPTKKEVEAFIESLPLEPTMVVHTGGGYHVHYMIEESLDPSADSDLIENLTSRIVSAVVVFHRERGYTPDTKVTANPQCSLVRAPGSLNRKASDSPVLVTIDKVSRRVSATDIFEAFPRPAAPVFSSAISASQAVAPDSDRVGDRFSMTVSPVTIAEFLGARAMRGGGVSFPRADGSFAPDPSIKLEKNDSGVEQLAFFGARVPEAWRAAGRLQKTVSVPTLNSFSLISEFFCGSDYKLAARLLFAFEADKGVFDVPALFAALKLDDGSFATAADVRELLAKLKPAPAPARGPLRLVEEGENAPDPAADEEEEVVPSDFLEAIETGTRAVEELTQGGTPLRVVVAPGSPDHGVWKNNPPGEPIRIADWVAFRPRASRLYRIENDGAIGEVRDATSDQHIARYDVVVVTGQGQVRTLRSLPRKTSLSYSEIASLSDLPVSPPSRREEERILDSVLYRAQFDTISKTSAIHLNSLGWVKLDEKWVYASPAGSIGSSGVVSEDVLKVVSPGVSGSPQVGAGARRGFPSILSDDPEGAELVRESVSQMLSLASRRVMLPLIGQMIVGHIPNFSRSGSLFLKGRPGSGKTTLVAATRSLISGVPVRSDEMDISLTQNNTLAGLDATLAYFRNTAATVDDFRISGEKVTDAHAQERVASIIQATYGQSPRAKSNKTGSIVQSVAPQLTAIISGEVAPSLSGEAVRGRTCVLSMNASDVNWVSPNNPSITPIQQFGEFVGQTDAPRKLMAWILRGLASMFEELGVDTVTGALEKQRNSFIATASESIETQEGVRAAEVSSSFATGWAAARAVANHLPDSPVSQAILEVAPSMEELSDMVTNLALENIEASKETSADKRILDWISQQVAGLLAHISPIPRNPAVEHEPGSEDLGFKHVNDKWVAQGQKLGIISSDYRFVHISNGAFRSASAALGLGLQQEQLDAAMAQLVAEGAPRVPRKPSRKFFPTLRATGSLGFTFPASLIGLGDEIVNTGNSEGEDES